MCLTTRAFSNVIGTEGEVAILRDPADIELHSMSRQASFLDYLHRYAAKDLDGIAAMFSEGITMRDWNLSV